MADSAQTPPIVPTKTRRPLLSLAMGVVIAAGLMVLVAGTTFAYLSLNTNTAFNIFESKPVQLQLVENGSAVENSSQTMTYGIGNKELQVANPADSADAVIRVSFAPQIISADSTEEATIYEYFAGGPLSTPVDNKIELTTTEGVITLHFASGWNDPENGWFFEDGFFYYNKVLEAGAQTPVLLSGVTSTFADGTTIEVVVSAEALQAYPDQARDVWGVNI